MAIDWKEFRALLGERLAHLRRSQKLTQHDVAARMGLKRHTGQSLVSQIEHGQTGNPDVKTIIAYLTACGIEPGTPDELLDRLGLPRASAPVEKPHKPKPVARVVKAEPPPLAWSRPESPSERQAMCKSLD